MGRFLFYLILQYFFNASLSTDIECSYGYESFWVTSSSYRCLTQKDPCIDNYNKTFINSTSGTHETGKNNQNVLGFFAYSKTINYFPNGLDKIYDNIEAIVIEKCHLREIHQTDVMVFPKLVAIRLRNNDIEVVEENLFQYNLLLKLVLFHNNKVVHIDPDVFDHLNSLSYLGFDHNKCMSMYIDGNSERIKEVIKEIKSKCTNAEYKSINANLKELEGDVRSLNPVNVELFQIKASVLEKQFNSSAVAHISVLARRLQKLKEHSLPLPLNYMISHLEQNLNSSKSNIMEKIDKFMQETRSVTTNFKYEIIESLNMTKSSLDHKLRVIDASLNNKIETIERSLTEFMSKLSAQMERAERRSNRNQNNLDDRLKVQNYKIDNSSQFNDMTMSALIIVCGFLITLVMIILYKKILFRDVDLDEL